MILEAEPIFDISLTATKAGPQTNSSPGARRTGRWVPRGRGADGGEGGTVQQRQLLRTPTQVGHDQQAPRP